VGPGDVSSQLPALIEVLVADLALVEFFGSCNADLTLLLQILGEVDLELLGLPHELLADFLVDESDGGFDPSDLVEDGGLDGRYLGHWISNEMNAIIRSGR
jgi:hypothetical protein